MDNELEVIHHEMEETRASLANKLDTLENHVLGTVHEATDAVAHTVEDVKSVVGSVSGSIQDTVESVTESVRHTFDISGHFRHHPWGMLCGAVTVGFIGGCMLGSSRRAKEEAAPAPRSSNGSPPPPRAVESQPDQSSGIPQILHDLKGLALGTLGRVAREMLAKALPEEMKEKVVKMVDDFTTKLGGKPLPASEETDSGEQQSPETGEQSHEDQTQDGMEEPQETPQGKSSQAGGKKGQQTGGRFDRRNPPSRR